MERRKDRRKAARLLLLSFAVLGLTARLGASDVEMPPGDRYPEIVAPKYPEARFPPIRYRQTISNFGDLWETTAPYASWGLGPPEWPFVLCTDMNGDGWPDYVCPIRVDYREPGMPQHWIARQRFHYGEEPRQVAVGDFDQDGWKDIAVSWVGIEILRSDRITRWPLHLPFSHLGRTVRYDSILATDANHDGHLDIVASRYERLEVDVFHGRGDGTFPDDPDYVLLPPDSTGYRTWRLRLEDLDGDGMLDLFYGDGGTGVLVAWRGEAGFDPPVRLLATVGRVEGAFDAGDVDLDGDLDVLTATREGALFLFRQEGRRRFAAGEVVRQLPEIGNDLRIQDLNADGNPEVVFLADPLPYFLILRGVGDGDYSRELLLRIPFTEDAFYFSVNHIQFCGLDIQFVRGDANQDGRVDLADAIRILRFLFGADGDFLSCPDAADANDDEWITVSDAVHVLLHLFVGGPAPPSPYPEPGWDWTNRDGSDVRMGGSAHEQLGCSPCWDIFAPPGQEDRCAFEVWSGSEHKLVTVHVPYPEG